MQPRILLGRRWRRPARARGTARRLAGFLESDLQDSPAAAHEILRAVDPVESGRLPSWERTGNAYTLSLSPGAP